MRTPDSLSIGIVERRIEVYESGGARHYQNGSSLEKREKLMCAERAAVQSSRKNILETASCVVIDP
jgi:hypothetical protein